MRETELRRLIAEEFLSVIQDPRVDRTRKHSLETILVISLLAVICGADSIVDIENYAKSRKQWLETFLDCPEVCRLTIRSADFSLRSIRRCSARPFSGGPLRW